MIGGASVIFGRAIGALLGRERPPWLSAATGFAALVIVAPLLLRLPGRGTTAAIVLGLLLIGAARIAYRDLRRAGDAGDWRLGIAVALIVVAAASIPFVISDRVGVLGSGVYTNDHAAQLYWADWLQHGFGPEPSAVRFGYPVGPQAVAAIAATVTGTNLVDAFNGLLLAIPALTALTALGALTAMPAGAPDRDRGAHRAPLPGRVLSRPERLQGDGDGVARGRLRDLPRGSIGRGGGPRRPPGGVAAGLRRARVAGAGRGVHVQRPGARLVRPRGCRCGSRSRASPGAAWSSGASCAAGCAPTGCRSGSPCCWS